jgi:hypothetical protein
LQVYVNSIGGWWNIANRLWQLSGDQGNSWKAASVSLEKFMGKSKTLFFVGTTGSSSTSDIVIDNVCLQATNDAGATGSGATTAASASGDDDKSGTFIVIGCVLLLLFSIVAWYVKKRTRRSCWDRNCCESNSRRNSVTPVNAGRDPNRWGVPAAPAAAGPAAGVFSNENARAPEQELYGMAALQELPSYTSRLQLTPIDARIGAPPEAPPAYLSVVERAPTFMQMASRSAPPANAAFAQPTPVVFAQPTPVAFAQPTPVVSPLCVSSQAQPVILHLAPHSPVNGDAPPSYEAAADRGRGLLMSDRKETDHFLDDSGLSVTVFGRRETDFVIEH